VLTESLLRDGGHIGYAVRGGTRRYRITVSGG